MNDMQIWFGSVINEINTQIDVNPIKDYVYNLKKELPKSNIGSDVNAWQSPNLEDTDILNPVKNEIFHNADVMRRMFNIREDKELVIGNMWAGINPRGGTNKPHTHPGALFSGVIYIQVPENSGNLCFIHPAQNHNYHFNVHTVTKWDTINSGERHIIPKVGKMIMFPGYQSHYVEPNLSDEDRITIGFNISLTDINRTTNT